MTEDVQIPDELADLPDKLYFRIGEVAALVGVEPHVLRYWEGEFNLRPQRSMSGQRLYRKQEISRFLRIRQLLHEKGYTVAGARKFLKDTPDMGPSVTPEVIQDAITRIQAIRSRITTLRDEASTREA